MELVLHIGMGKSGSSAVQHALRQNADILPEQGAHHVGMWLDPTISYPARPTHNEFFVQPPEVWRERAGDLAAFCERKEASEGIQCFIVSNESFYHHHTEFEAFVDAFRSFGNVRATAYVRKPSTYLPSAFVQWGLVHKTVNGPLPSFEDQSRKHLGHYQDVLAWKQKMGDILTLRHYDDVPDVVTDFMKFCGVTVPAPKERVYARGESAEIVFRALFNGRFEGQVTDSEFNQLIWNKFQKSPRRVEQVVAETLDYSRTVELIWERRDMFHQFQDATGLDLLNDLSVERVEADARAVRNRLIDYMLEMSMTQAETIRNLQNRVAALESRIGG